MPTVPIPLQISIPTPSATLPESSLLPSMTQTNSHHLTALVANPPTTLPLQAAHLGLSGHRPTWYCFPTQPSKTWIATMSPSSHHPSSHLLPLSLTTPMATKNICLMPQKHSNGLYFATTVACWSTSNFWDSSCITMSPSTGWMNSQCFSMHHKNPVGHSIFLPTMVVATTLSNSMD